MAQESLAMSWTFEQATGRLYDAQMKLIAVGYSGNGAGLNNASMQNVMDVGPIPQGVYTFGELIPHDPVVGEYAIPLIPDPNNEMFGRSAFFIHGNDPQNDHNASEGCIVLPFTIRQEVWESGDHQLEVVS
jgi:Protein of unknown function (DUF2778)